MVWGPTAVERKSTRLHASHAATAYAVFCLKKQPANALLPRSAVQLSFLLGAVASQSVALSLHDALPIWLPTGTRAGEQLTPVLVSCLRAVTTKLPALLRWVVSPL